MPASFAARPSHPMRPRPLAVGALLVLAACGPDAKTSGGGPSPGATAPDTASDTAAVRVAAEDALKASRAVDSLQGIPRGAPPGCSRVPEKVQHWEVQSAVLLDSAGTQLVARAKATLSGYKYLRKAPDSTFFRRDVPVGRLTLHQRYRGVDAGTYCLSAYFQGSASDDMRLPGLWSLRLYALDSLGGNPVRRLRFERRQPEEQGNDDPRIPVRFVVETPGPAPTGQGAPAGSSFLAGALVPRLLARLQEDTELRPPSAWFRCGAGCCSGSTYFE